MEFFVAYPLALLIAGLLLGLAVGSFLNVVILRLPVMMERDWQQQCREYLDPDTPAPTSESYNLARPASHCPACRQPISALENIPVLSYLVLRGKCRHCGTRISPRYPIIELVTALLSVLVVQAFGPQWLTLAVLLFTWALIALTMIDLDHQLLPDTITLPLLWLGLLVNTQHGLTSLESAVWGAIAGYLILWCVYWGFRLITGKEGMGFGDFKLLAALGAWLGWQALPQIILLSSLVGAVVGITLISLRGQDRNIPIPFGPYLAAAGFISLMWGPQLTALYYRLMM